MALWAAMCALPLPAAAQNQAPPAAASRPLPRVQNYPAPAAAPVSADNPRWPKDQPAVPAVVRWDSHGLRVSARNSSLKQILAEVSLRIGAKLDGTVGDERVFGEYGPAQAKEVLAQLLQGSAYNVMLVGDQGQGTPRQIVLSARGTGNAAQAGAVQPTQSSQDDDSDSEVEDTPVRTAPMPRPPMNPPPVQPQPVPPPI